MIAGGEVTHDRAGGLHAGARSVDAYDPRSRLVPVARTGGVTSAITGLAAWVSLADAGLAVIKAPAAMRGALGRGAGVVQPRVTHQTRLRDRYRTLPAR